MAMVRSNGRYVGAPEANNVEDFRRGLAGTIVRPGDADYDTARAVWNGMIDRRPAIIAYCANVNDVIQSIAFARETGILTSVRSGGHNIAGSSLCDGGLVIDVSRMNKVNRGCRLVLRRLRDPGRDSRRRGHRRDYRTEDEPRAEPDRQATRRNDADRASLHSPASSYPARRTPMS
jgi:hypothetical protein